MHYILKPFFAPGTLAKHLTFVLMSMPSRFHRKNDLFANKMFVYKFSVKPQLEKMHLQNATTRPQGLITPRESSLIDSFVLVNSGTGPSHVNICLFVCFVYFYRCCKMHDWCYSTSSCMDLEWHLPYLVPFKWKCNGGAPYCSKFVYILSCQQMDSVSSQTKNKTKVQLNLVNGLLISPQYNND